MSGGGGVCRYVTAVCCCAWSGRIAATADCPRCGENDHARMTTPRAECLERLSANPRALGNDPGGRKWLVKHGLVVPAGAARKAGGRGGNRTPAQPFRVTPNGIAALAAYRVLVPARVPVAPSVISGPEAIARRERAAIAGMTAARHADIPEAP